LRDIPYIARARATHLPVRRQTFTINRAITFGVRQARP
jgi:hypothetical protein